jgi:aspartate 1-decarboxylase
MVETVYHSNSPDPMLKSFLHGKIHRARVTHVALDYEGSLSVDADLLAAAGIGDHEQIHVVNLRNGARFVTYAILAPAGSGIIQVNGAAAHLNEVGDLVIIFAYALVNEAEAATLTPTVIYVDENNRPRA